MTTAGLAWCSEVNEARQIELARTRDVPAMARMSRDLIEQGLGWGWTAPVIAKVLAKSEANAIVVRGGDDLDGFALMQYLDTHAHLMLLAVQPRARRQGIAAHLLRWLERTAIVAELDEVRLEVRYRNRGALSFYERMGYARTGIVTGYYRGVEDAVRMSRRLYPGENLGA